MNTSIDTELLGEAPAFTSLLRSLDIASATDVSIILYGESGTGKELLARRIHRQSARSDQPFVAINCAALPEALAESELFGHIKGAFTNALANNPGRIAMAEGGTLFLDEIGEMAPGIQSKLLRFLESGEYQPVGSLNTRCANIRLIAATNADLAEKVESGSFRADLYYRLNIVPFHIPALRERQEDIELLLGHLTQRFSVEHELAPPEYTTDALAALKRYRWPGNIRELRNFSERMVILFSGQQINRDKLPGEFQTTKKKPWLLSIPEEGIKLDELEQDLLRQALEKCRGNRSQAARILGLTRYAFLYRLKKYQLQA